MRKNHETPLKGRFIKNTHPNAQRVNIEKFNLVEICTADITYTDNQSSSIIHQKLHDREELDAKIRTPQRLDEKFKIENLRPVIKPLDFTSDWSKQRTYMSRNKSTLEEDDEENPEFINLAREIKEQSNISFDSDDQEAKENNGHIPLKISSEKPQETEYKTEEAEEAEEQSSSEPVSDDFESEAIQDTQAESAASSENETNAQTSIEQEETAENFAGIEAENTTELNPTQAHDEFIPMSADNLNQPTRSQAEIDEAYENAKAAGYQDGYMQGEEKGTIQSKENLKVLSEGLKDMVTELESLKANVLHNAQENFQIICQTMVESILNHHFKANPDALSTVIKKAMDESIENDNFTILVSKQVIDQVKDSIEESLRDKIKPSDDLEGFNFKIESNLTVIDGNINQIVTDLLEQADLDLFKEDERAG